MVGERFSLKGWKLKEWVKGNWVTIKEVVKVGAPLILGISLFQDNPMLIGVVTVLGKLALDTLYYYVNK